MSKQHKPHKKKGHRNNGGPPRPAPPRRPRLPRKSDSRSNPDDPIDWGTIAATVGGAAGGAVVGAYASKRWSPGMVSTAMLVGGGVAAATTHGAARVASTGIMAAGAGQFALNLMMPRNGGPFDADPDPEPTYERRQAALPEPVLREALGRAHDNVAALYPDDDYAAHTFD